MNNTELFKAFKFFMNNDGSLKDSSIMGIVIAIGLITFGTMYYFLYVYDGLANYRITIINKPKRMLSKNKQNDVIASPMTYKINSSDTEISYSMWLYLEDFGFKYGKEKHIFSHGYNPRFYSKFKDHRIMIKLNETTNTIRVIITSSKEDTDWCSKNDYENDNCININGKKHRTYPTEESGSKTIARDFKLHNIPIKKWTQLTITIVGDNASVYINGHLIKQIVLKGEIIPLPKSYLFIGSSLDEDENSGFGGKIAKVEVFKRHLEAGQVFSLYREGNLPKDTKKKKYIKTKDVACLKENSVGCDTRYEFDTYKNGCCPNLRCDPENAKCKSY